MPSFPKIEKTLVWKAKSSAERIVFCSYRYGGRKSFRSQTTLQLRKGLEGLTQIGIYIISRMQKQGAENFSAPCDQ
jgi:hypothetical protein